MGHFKDRATAFAAEARGAGIAAQGLKAWGLANPDPNPDTKPVTEHRGVVGALRRAAEVSGRNVDSDRAEARVDATVAKLDAENASILSEGAPVVAEVMIVKLSELRL